MKFCNDHLFVDDNNLLGSSKSIKKDLLDLLMLTWKAKKLNAKKISLNNVDKLKWVHSNLKKKVSDEIKVNIKS